MPLNNPFTEKSWVNLILIEESLAFACTSLPKLAALVAIAEAKFPAGSLLATKLAGIEAQLLTIGSHADKAAGLWPTVQEVVSVLAGLLPKNEITDALSQVAASQAE